LKPFAEVLILAEPQRLGLRGFLSDLK